MKFRKKPGVIEAMQFWPDQPLPFRQRGPYVQFFDGKWFVVTAHGRPVELAPGDWVILEPPGSHPVMFAAYPVKPDIFAATYEAVEEY